MRPLSSGPAGSGRGAASRAQGSRRPRVLLPIRTFTVGPGIPPGQPVAGCERVADCHRRLGITPIPEHASFRSWDKPATSRASGRCEATHLARCRGMRCPPHGRRTPDETMCPSTRRGGHVTDLLALAADLPPLDFAPEEVLLQEGSAPGRMFVLETGSVVIEHAGVPFARIDTPGAVLGEMAAVLDKPATATVRAAGPVTVRVVDDPVEFLTARPGAALAVLRTTASR